MTDAAVGRRHAAAFATAAESFCRWVEAAPGDAQSETRLARQLVARLYCAAVDLEEGWAESDDVDPTGPARETILSRFESLPTQFYSDVDQLEIPAAESTLGDLADDLADIWSDLKIGLALHGQGKLDEAAREWRWRFDTHWGAHAVAALRVLHALAEDGRRR